MIPQRLETFGALLTDVLNVVDIHACILLFSIHIFFYVDADVTLPNSRPFHRYLVVSALEEQKKSLTFLGVLHADASIAIKTRWAAAADIADMWGPAVDALNSREARSTGTCC